MPTDIHIDCQDDIMVLTLDDPETRNAITKGIYEKAMSAIIDAGSDPTIRAIILTGANGVFCSGGNVGNFPRRRTQPCSVSMASVNQLHDWIKAIRACPKPVISAVEKVAAGAGVSLALSCDLIISSREARFVVAYVKIGLSPDGGATASLMRLLPRQMVTEMCLFGDPVEAETLHRHGVINRLSEPGSALEDAMAIANRLADGPQNAIRRIKKLIEAAPDNSFGEQLDMEAGFITESFRDEETRIGFDAFLNKQKPDFRKANGG
ncbi:MAG: enoyl-CoA hydratase [Rhodospirillaceae bacterium]|nr:enoyl-CoA hydratase [Rhodospirillaceae bacterium]